MVADAFGKRHSDVLESVENIKTENSAVTEKLKEDVSNFGLMFY